MVVGSSRIKDRIVRSRVRNRIIRDGIVRRRSRERDRI
jgi:hypothetical protein